MKLSVWLCADQSIDAMLERHDLLVIQNMTIGSFITFAASRGGMQ